MGILRRTATAGLVWLTAVMTLTAGLPHFRCECPNGSVKPFCFGVFCSSTGNCCGNACPAARGSVRACADAHRAACCCYGAKGRRAAPSGGHPVAQGRGCVKSFAPHTRYVVSRPRAADGAAVNYYAAAVTNAYSRTALRLPRGAHPPSPPPSDLVIVLQRFLI